MLSALSALLAGAGLVPALLTRIAQVNDVSASPKLLPFLVGSERVGSISPRIIDELKAWPHVFDCSSPERVTLAAELDQMPSDERNAAVHTVAEALREKGVITKWRDEQLALVSSFSAKPALLVERRFVPLLGGRGYGVAINGFSVHPESGEQHLWLATRAADKATWPGMLDTLAAGAMSAGSSPLEAARAEAAEEAGVSAELAARALTPVGAVSYYGVDEDPILPKEDVFFVFDLE